MAIFKFRFDMKSITNEIFARSKGMIFFFFLTCILVCLNAICNAQEADLNFASPIRIDPRLSANFGELRKNHFHSGLDYRTEGRIGLPVYAVEDGVISRIFVSSYGFGKALYIDHPNGYTSVYAHLDKFIPEIEAFVKTTQYVNESYSLNEFPNKEVFSIKKGDLIGFSGNSGSSGGPHLHFEIRETKSEKIVNPLGIQFIPIADSIPPKIKSVIIYQIDTIKQVFVPSIFKSINPNSIDVNDIILVPKYFFIGVETADYMPNSMNEYLPKCISAAVDNITYFNFIMEKFAFSETRYINSTIDYSLFTSQNREVIRAYKDPNNKLSLLSNMNTNGIITINDSLPHSLTLEVSDCNGNAHHIEFRYKHGAANLKTPPLLNQKKALYINKSNTYKTQNSIIKINSDALYQSLLIDYEEKDFIMHSPLIKVGSNQQALQKEFEISIKSKLPEEMAEKAFIARGTPNDFSSIGGHYKNGVITSTSSSFGYFYVDIDTIAPTTKPNFDLNKKFSKIPETLNFTITDDKTGVNAYDAYIDGKWTIAEYDFKQSLIKVSVDDTRISKHQEHFLELYTSDEVGNTNYFSCTFYY